MRDLWVLRLLKGGGPFPKPEEAVNIALSDEDQAALAQIQQRGIVGTSAQVKERLDAMAAQFGLDEVIIVTITYDHQVRRRSYELLADAYGLTPRN